MATKPTPRSTGEGTTVLDDNCGPVADTESIEEIHGSSFPATTNIPLEIGAVTGDISQNDVIMPRLFIAYGVGQLAEFFNPGDLILNKEHQIAAKEQPLECVVLSCNKYYKENKAYDPNDRELPRVLPSEKAVRDAGFTTIWSDHPEKPRARIRPDYQPASTMTLLLKKPEDLVSPLFSMKFESTPDTSWTPARFYADKTAWVGTAKEVISAGQLSLSGYPRVLLHGLWDFQTRIEKRGGNPTVVPSMKLDSINSDEFVAELSQRFGTTH